MKTKYLCPLFSLSLFGSLLGLSGCSNDHREPGLEYEPDMVYSQAYEAYSESIFKKDGGSMLSAPKDSIPRGYQVFTYGKTDNEKERAGNEMKDPRPETPARHARGKYLYQNMCMLCHGEKGQGDGPVAKKYAEPPAFNGRSLRNYKDGQFYHAIVVGYGDMPSHAVQLDDHDRWDLILYLHELQKME